MDAPQKVEAPNIVECCTMTYTYAIFNYHYTIIKNKVFKGFIQGEDGDRVEAIAICHLDTSEWSPSHVTF